MSWQPIHTARPRQKVIVGWTNELGNWRTTLATFYEMGDIELDESPEDWVDEEGRNVVAGWWEDSQTREEWYLDERPTHWMPLPPPPDREDV